MKSKAAPVVNKRLERRNAATRRPSQPHSQSDDPLIPDKLYFRIGEVARICRLPAYVLRFWETEFPQLRPTKSSTGQRMYRRNHVECALHIRRLLYREGFTIPGARQQLLQDRKGRRQDALPFAGGVAPEALRKLRQELRQVLTIVSAKAR